MIEVIPFTQILKTKYAEMSECALTNCLKVEIALPWISTGQPISNISKEWKEAVLEAGIPNKDSVFIFVAFPSKELLGRWKSFLDYHSERKR